MDGVKKPNYIEFTTLGGERRFLLRSEDWQSNDGTTFGHETDGVLDIESERWIYRFQGERIQEAISPGGARFTWKYEDGNIVGIRRGSDDVLTVERASGSLRIHSDSGDFTFRREGSDSQHATLTFPDGREDRIKIASDGEDVSRMTIVSSGKGNASGTLAPRVYRWKTSTGALLSDSDFTYEVRHTDMGEDILHRVDRKGRSEWYAFDVERGLATYKRQDGSRVQSWYHVEHGPRYMKCFRMDTLSGDQKLVSSRLLKYDVQGNVEKEWIEQGPAALEKAAGVRYIAVDEAERLHAQSGTLFLDARKRGEYEHAHIPGAVHLGRSSFDADYPALETRLKAADTLVVYCVSRQCEDSSIVATRLSQLGYASVILFEGGWAEWWKRHR